MAQGIVADRTEATRRLIRNASGVIILVLLAIAASFAISLWRIGEVTRHSECNVLEHRIVSRESFRTVIWTLRDIALAAADPDEKEFKEAAERILVPPKIDPEVIHRYTTTCENVVGHDTEDTYGP